MKVRLAHAALFTAALLSLTGCSGGGGGGSSTPDLSGIWQYSSGPSLIGGGNINAFGGQSAADIDLDFLELDADGSGRGYGSAGPGRIGCGSLVFAALNENVVRIDFPAGEIYRTYRYALEDASLTLIDENGIATVFTSATAIPASSQCENVTEVTRVNVSGTTGYGPPLVSDGTNLYFYNGTAIASIPVMTLVEGTPITAITASATIPIAMEGPDFWLRSSTVVQRRTVADALVDTIGTSVDLSHELYVDAGAVVGTKLFLLGYSYAQSRTELLRVDASGEPDLLESALPLPFYTPVLTADSAGTVWTITDLLGPVLVSLDQTTGGVTRTITLPPRVYYEGVVIIGQDAYLLGSDFTTYLPVIVHVTLPS